MTTATGATAKPRRSSALISIAVGIILALLTIFGGVQAITPGPTSAKQSAGVVAYNAS